MYVCMYVCIYVCIMYVCITYLYSVLCLYLCTYPCVVYVLFTYVYMYVDMYVYTTYYYIYIYIYMQVCIMYICMSVCIHVCMHVCKYVVYICMYCMHICIHRLCLRFFFFSSLFIESSCFVPRSGYSGLEGTVSHSGHVSSRFQSRILFFVILTVTNVRVLPWARTWRPPNCFLIFMFFFPVQFNPS
jgi:hypothetical protein